MGLQLGPGGGVLRLLSQPLGDRRISEFEANWVCRASSRTASQDYAEKYYLRKPQTNKEQKKTQSHH